MTDQTQDTKTIAYDFKAFNRPDISRDNVTPAKAQITMKEGLGTEIILETDKGSIQLSDTLVNQFYDEIATINYMPYVYKQWEEYCRDTLELDEIPPLDVETCKQIASSMTEYLTTIGDEYEIDALYDHFEMQADDMGLLERELE